MNERHPEAATLEAYAAGALASGASAVVAIHLKACLHCRNEVARLEAVAGALLAEEPPAALAPDALERAMAGLDRPEKPTPRLDLATVMAKARWLRLPGGLAVKKLANLADPGERVFLIRGEPGARLPRHGHRGAERLVVLEGALEDDRGRYGAGDFSERGASDHHEPIVCAGEPCVCLSATEGALRLSGVARWLQPVLGF